MKKFSFWLWATVIFQFITGLIHSVSLFVTPPAQNESEKQLIKLMDTYHLPASMGFSPSFANMVFALSSCFTMFYLFGGLLNLYLYRQKVSMNVMKGVLGISVIMYGLSFGIMLAFTFLPPIICTGLVFISCLGAYFSGRSR